MFLMSPTTSHKSRYIPFVLALLIGGGIFYFFDPGTILRDPVDLAIQQAQRDIQKQNYRAALSVLLPVVEKNPNQPELRYWLGAAYAGLQQPDIAFAQYQLALRLDEFYPEPALALGLAYLQSGQMAAAQTMRSRLDAACARGRGCAEKDNLSGLITQAATRPDRPARR